ncbi:MAG: DUF488 family protein [Nitrospinae bacterium]|nr:DUF488 family protein [Nitrospinota bacterium]
MSIKLKRVYDKQDENDGFRILIDRLWPRGLSKEKTEIDLWQMDIAPSDTLRKWFRHEPEKWKEFKRRYFKELKDKEEFISFIHDKAQKGIVTLLYGAKEEKFNNAVALKEYIETRMKLNNLS